MLRNVNNSGIREVSDGRKETRDHTGREGGSLGAGLAQSTQGKAHHENHQQLHLLHSGGHSELRRCSFCGWCYQSEGRSCSEERGILTGSLTSDEDPGCRYYAFFLGKHYQDIFRASAGSPMRRHT